MVSVTARHQIGPGSNPTAIKKKTNFLLFLELIGWLDDEMDRVVWRHLAVEFITKWSFYIVKKKMIF